MINLSEQLIKDIIGQGVDTFFGVQGGACARLIENIIKFNGKFIPVLNEQSAGYYAHGYYMATKKTAGLIFTTGPGLTNGVSGIAACYYDRVPLVTLVGQVPKRINLADLTKTRMVGFQEVPHLKICKPITDEVYKIKSIESYSSKRNKILSNLKSKVQCIEILDDSQREKLTKKFKVFREIKKKENNIKINDSIKKLIKNSNNPVILLGAGFINEIDWPNSLKDLNKLNIKIACTWGGQKIQKHIDEKNKNFIGIFGNHNPGYANENIKQSDLIVSLGCSLLQHQVGKIHDNFAPLAKIIFINNDKNECSRAKIQFKKRLINLNMPASSFVKKILNLRKKKIKLFKINKKKNILPVEFLTNLLKKSKKDSIFFSDAGATLSWTYQASNNLKNAPNISTAFNLHSMGYANCAAIGASIKKNNVYCIIGDGSLPMNNQELAWSKKYPIKIVVINNNGYGIIRQTQRMFYKSKFYGSDFKNKKSALPNFNLKKMLEQYEIKTKIINNKNYFNDLRWLIKSKQSSALILNIDYNFEVNT